MSIKVRTIQMDTTYQTKPNKKSKIDKNILNLKRIYDAMMRREKKQVPDPLSQDIMNGL